MKINMRKKISIWILVNLLKVCLLLLSKLFKYFNDNSYIKDMEKFTIPYFDKAASKACLFELYCRLLANINGGFYHSDLGTTIKYIIDNFDLNEEDKKLLHNCNYIRNKLFHVELNRVSGKFRSLGFHLKEKNVYSYNLKTGKNGFVPTLSFEEGTIFGWLIESTLSGSFVSAFNLFSDGLLIISKLMDGSNNEKEINVP